MVLDRAESPFTVARTSAGLSSKVAEMASKLSAIRSVSSSPAVSPRSPSAWVTSYGEVVRAAGMRWPGSCGPVPSGSTARYFSPSSVLMPMATVLELPIHASSTRKVTLTRAPSRATSVTSPTFTPAIRTSSRDSRPAASVKSAA